MTPDDPTGPNPQEIPPPDDRPTSGLPDAPADLPGTGNEAAGNDSQPTPPAKKPRTKRPKKPAGSEDGPKEDRRKNNPGRDTKLTEGLLDQIVLLVENGFAHRIRL